MGIEDKIDDLLDEVGTCAWRLCSVKLDKASPSGLFCKEGHQREWQWEQLHGMPTPAPHPDVTPATMRSMMGRRHADEVAHDVALTPADRLTQWRVARQRAYQQETDRLRRNSLATTTIPMDSSFLDDVPPFNPFPLQSVWANSIHLPRGEPSVAAAVDRARVSGLIHVGGRLHGQHGSFAGFTVDTVLRQPRPHPYNWATGYFTSIDPVDYWLESDELSVDTYTVQGYMQLSQSARDWRGPIVKAELHVALSLANPTTAMLMDALTRAEAAGWRP